MEILVGIHFRKTLTLLNVRMSFYPLNTDVFSMCQKFTTLIISSLKHYTCNNENLFKNLKNNKKHKQPHN